MKISFAGSIILLIILSHFISCKSTAILCAKTKPSDIQLSKNKVTALKYYLPKKVLTFYCSALVKGQVAYDKGQGVLVDKAQLILSDTIFLTENIEQGESYYIIPQNGLKSITLNSIGFSYYNNGVLKALNAESSNMVSQIAEAVISMAASAALSSSCAFPGVRAETKDTSFRLNIAKTIEFMPGKTSDTIDIRQFLPKMTNNVYFIVSLDNAPLSINDMDSIQNGFVYYDPKFLSTVVSFHSSENKQGGIVLLERNILYPQLGNKQVLYLPVGFSNGKMTAEFTPGGVLSNVSYFKGK